jgi:16S rRNA (cytosine967-C5)-methyltransferase
LFQLFHTGIPEHAAVNETVSLARGMRGVINAILRNAQRNRESLEKQLAEAPLSVSHSHPDFLVERWQEQHSEENTRALCQWNNEPPLVYGRVNRLIPAAVDGVKTSSRAAPLKGCPGFYRFSELPPVEWLEGGWVYIQDPSTCLACDLLDPHRGENILDACAAPGGKTALLADRMKNTGRIVAADSQPERVERLRENLRRLKVNNTRPAVINWLRPKKDFRAGLPEFDAILVDVPCSNTGVMRRRVDVRWRLRPGEFADLQRLQLTLAETCLPLLKKGGRLVYSTCSLEREENRDVVDLLRERNRDKLELEAITESLPWRDGYDGAFAARLRKTQ